MKNDTSLFSLRNIKILTNMQKKFFEILVLTALTVGLFWTILKLTPKSALLSFTILYNRVMDDFDTFVDFSDIYGLFLKNQVQALIQ